MKAIIYEKYGTPNVLTVRDIKKPIPKDNEVLIKVHAAEVTKADCEMRSFHFPVKWFWLPLRLILGISKPKNQVLGGYFSGEIESFGKEVSKFNIGDNVFGVSNLRLGAHAEFICLPASYTIITKPTNLSFEEAAALPLGGLNALHFLRKANIQKGESLLINGAGGSIGIFGVQIAKAMGAKVTVVDTGIKEKMLRSIGADNFFDYTKEDVTESGQTFDVIFNIVATSSYSAWVNMLKPNGRYLLANPRLSDMLRSIMTSKFTDKKATFIFAGEKEEELLTLKKMIEEGTIKSIVDKTYSYEQAADAHRRVESEQRLGAVIVKPPLNNEMA
ncbi:NAD(P)-dependent alcohol dehydrogenase [Marinomonas sp. RSW2]|uniref:NAD(P)-dependent alcohol dehydrogenase n=1 Tax=Marinomonas maritima TaxID=2940935 RepID=A0ABT5WJ13_9GAMM|nr:NAD(P)-dependent alcohol dehydrogenase [Marinomonas maritima]MDE8604806.1 NAD(P)-dependent alcohol dehydrogenase [Marinomonas maritima]